MRSNRYWLRDGKFPFLTFFVAGLLAGIVIMNLGKSILLENTGLLDEYTLYHMKYMTVDGSALFYYVIKERFGQLIILAVLSTTYLGLAVCAAVTLWYGVCGGVFLATAVMRYGIKGILLVAVGVFPQYIIYVPGMVLMLYWCRNLYQKIYLDRVKVSPMQWIGRLLGIFLLFGLGCVLESFLNPHLFRGLLQFF